MHSVKSECILRTASLSTLIAASSSLFLVESPCLLSRLPNEAGEVVSMLKTGPVPCPHSGLRVVSFVTSRQNDGLVQQHDSQQCYKRKVGIPKLIVACDVLAI